ncbi:MAG TPA: hypothetical protein VNW50_02055, partial [Streptosporangiaceae bacterium]|nr:hypothetical protein [Streptosporangiaceae bacterium]
TNACLTALARRKRRELPSGRYDPEPDPSVFPAAAGPEVAWLDPVPEPAAPQARALLDQYIAAFENADAAALERLLVHDAILEATPLRTWFAGRKTCVPFLRNHVLGSPGDWRMLATSANGQPAAAAYTRDQDGNYQPYGICVLTVTSAGIRRVSSFGDPKLVTVFGFRPDMALAKDAEPAPSRCLKDGGTGGHSSKPGDVRACRAAKLLDGQGL